MKDRFNDENKHKKTKVIMMIIILIIVILMLLTSCSCTSKFWGKIGNLFNFGEHQIDDGTNDPEIKRNTELYFLTDENTISLSDKNLKISFAFKNITPKEYACITDDASIATCYVENDYVVVIPKKEGSTKITLSTKTNGKTYEATTNLKVTAPKKYIKLSSTKGTINLNESNVKKLSFELVGLDGKVKVTSSNEKVATAVIKNGLLIITGKKPGSSTITLTVEFGGKTYETSYDLTIINKDTTKPNTPGGNEQNPEDPENPSVNPPVENKDSDSTLKSLTDSKKEIKFDSKTLNYSFGVWYWTRKISFDAIPNSDKATLSYIYNGEKVDDLNKLKLNVGDNIVKIIVTAEDGSTTTYQITINRAKSSNNYLKNLEVTSPSGVSLPKFDKHVLNYDLTVGNKIDKISLEATKKKKKAQIYYTYNGVSVGSLEDLELNVGLNTVEITVVAQDGTSRQYTVNITRENQVGELDSNSKLKDLTISGKDSFGFNPNVYDYIVGVSATVNNVSISAIPSSDKYKDISYTFNGVTVDSLDDLKLETGDNTVKITVTAEDGTTSTYTIVINKAAKNTSNSLTSISTSEGTLKPDFDENTLSYEVFVDSTTSKIDVNVKKKNENANISATVNGKKLDSLKGIELEEGKNVIKIDVTSEDGTRTYEVVVYKPVPEKDTDSTLKSLKNLTTSSEIPFDPTVTDYSIGVDPDIEKITLEAIKNSDKAKVEYTFNGDTVKNLEDLKLKTGDNTVKILVTAEDNIHKTEYTVVINKAADKNVYLKDLTATDDKGNKLDFEFDKNNTNPIIKVDSKTDSISLKGTAESPKSKVEYFDKSGNKISDINNIKLNSGENIVIIKVTSESGDTREYTVKIDKEYPSTNNFLKDLNVEGEVLTEEFVNTKNYYTVNVPYNKDKINVNAIKDDEKSTISYNFNGEDINLDVETLKDLKLKEGKNELIITVVSESGDKNTYSLVINRPVRTVSFEKDSYDIYLEKGEYRIKYDILEDGTPIAGEYDKVEVTIPDFDGTYKIGTGDDEGYVIIKPNKSMLFTSKDMTIKYNDKTATTKLNFVIEEYEVNPLVDDYKFILNKNNEFGDVILNTNLFSNVEEKVTSTKIENGIILKQGEDKYIKIVSNNPNVVLSYDSNELGPSSLEIKVTSSVDATANLTITMGAFGNTNYPAKNVKVTIERQYVLTIKPNGGVFNEFTPDYEFTMGANDVEDLTKLDIPYKIVAGTNCQKVYKFLGYSFTENGEVKYTSYKGDENPENIPNKVNGITKDTILYAIYDEGTIIDKPEDTDTKWLYITDIPLFHNEEYYKKYNKDKIIYPGANGSYTAQIKNESKSKITIVGLKLTEETICIDTNRCLNMGYIIKDSVKYNFYMGESGKFEVLHGTNTADGQTQNGIPLYTNYIKFANTADNDETIVIEPDATVDITFQWRWVDNEDAIVDGNSKKVSDDKLDTKIGENAAEGLNDKYRLTIGVEFSKEEEICEIP